MPQDRESGAAGDAYGRSMAPRIARALGASLPGRSSNECVLNGQRVVIKCARRRTKSVGVTHLMLERIDLVVGAFEADDGSFEVLSLDVPTYRRHMSPTRSTGPSAGRVGQVDKSAFRQHGRSLGRINAGR